MDKACKTLQELTEGSIIKLNYQEALQTNKLGYLLNQEQEQNCKQQIQLLRKHIQQLESIQEARRQKQDEKQKSQTQNRQQILLPFVQSKEIKPYLGQDKPQSEAGLVSQNSNQIVKSNSNEIVQPICNQVQLYPINITSEEIKSQNKKNKKPGLKRRVNLLLNTFLTISEQEGTNNKNSPKKQAGFKNYIYDSSLSSKQVVISGKAFYPKNLRKEQYNQYY